MPSQAQKHLQISKLASEAIEESRVLARQQQQQSGSAPSIKKQYYCDACKQDDHSSQRCFYNAPEVASPHWKQSKQVGEFTAADLGRGNTYRNDHNRDSDAAAIGLAAQAQEGIATQAQDQETMPEVTAWIGNGYASYLEDLMNGKIAPPRPPPSPASSSSPANETPHEAFYM